MVTIKVLTVLCCVLAGVLAGGKYTSKYDNVDLDEILTTERLYKAYFACIMDEGKCTPDGKELKDNLQEAFDTGCSECNESQEKSAVKLIGHMINEKKEDWDRVCAKYDHNGKWRKFYEDRV